MCGGGFAPPSLALYFLGFAREGAAAGNHMTPRKVTDSHRPSAHQMAQPFSLASASNVALVPPAATYGNLRITLQPKRP
jgi:hypothetical protein